MGKYLQDPRNGPAQVINLLSAEMIRDASQEIPQKIIGMLCAGAFIGAAESDFHSRRI
jgi:hypothetical protein